MTGLGQESMRRRAEEIGARLEVRQAEVLGGQPQRALLEFTWAPTARGTPERRSFVIFVSLRRTLDQWCIEEIRVFS